ncbi:MAG: hypothetical protein IJS54_06035 [Desulfovibrio sp.]|nr:hypothetical protein [Desulfovibrio sp.]
MSQVNNNSQIPQNFPFFDNNPIENKKIQEQIKLFYQQASDVPKEGTKGSDSADKGFTPDLPKTTNPASIQDLMLANLSPAAQLAAMYVQESAKQNELNQKLLLEQSKDVQANMEKQAENIEKGAMRQMVTAMVGAGVSLAGCAISAVQIAKIPNNLSSEQFQKAMNVPNLTQKIGQSLDTTISSGGVYGNAQTQKDNKKLDATIEQHRTNMEALRNSMQAQRDLIGKSIDFMNSMQSSMNQTRARILG